MLKACCGSLMMSRWFIMVAVLLLTACTEGESSVDQPRTIYASDEQTGVIAVVLPPYWAGLQAADASLMVGNGGKAVRAYESVITDLEAGMTAGTVSAIIKEALIGQVEDTPEAVALNITSALSARTASIRYTFGMVTELELAGRNAVALDGLAISSGDSAETADDIVLEVLVIVLDAGAAYGVLFVAAPFTEMESYRAQWDEIAASFRFMTAAEARATQSAATATCC
jgi:hypothetical protein